MGGRERGRGGGFYGIDFITFSQLAFRVHVCLYPFRSSVLESRGLFKARVVPPELGTLST